MEAQATPDFSGYATKAGLKCTDGRTILKDAFAHQNESTVPLVWQHGHNDPANVLGHGVLENRNDGVYVYGFFNDTEGAKNARTLVQHEDIKSLSIYANQLTEKGKQVLHGFIREVSLVLSGANPGALIDNITLAHADGDMVTLEDEAIIYTGLDLRHDDADPGTDSPNDAGNAEELPAVSDKTIQEIYDSMTPDQQTVCHYMVGAAMEDNEGVAQSDEGTSAELIHDDNEQEGQRRMSRNVFEQSSVEPKEEKHELTHDAMQEIFASAQRGGSLKQAVEDYGLKHGIENMDVLFPEVRALTSTPEFDSRRMQWVSGVLSATRKSPFTRIKSIVADITWEEARARGYITGNLKKEEWISVSKRITTPTTIYKKQKLDRDDILDITDFNVVTWLQSEMRVMLDEELARAILLGDGRDVADEDHILDPVGAAQGAGIRSIVNDHELYAARVNINLGDANSSPSEIIDNVVSAMRLYKGSGNPTFYTTLPVITSMLLVRDTLGRRIYGSVSDIAAEMGVSSVVAVEVMENPLYANILGIIVNLSDYTIGTDQGGDVNFFDFFDIDYNQYKYLLETRVSGGLTKIRSALVLQKTGASDVAVTPTAPSFDGSTITIPTVSGVTYKRADTDAAVTGTVAVPDGSTLEIYAVAAAGKYFAPGVKDRWSFMNTPG
jgi:hypothetical protein